MRNLGRFNLKSLKKTKNWKSNFFPYEKLNYSSEILLWYYLFILLKRIKLEKGQKIIAFELYQKERTFAKLKLICHQFNHSDEAKKKLLSPFKNVKKKAEKIQILETIFGLKKTENFLKMPGELNTPKSFVFFKKYFSLTKLIHSLRLKKKVLKKTQNKLIFLTEKKKTLKKTQKKLVFFTGKKKNFLKNKLQLKEKFKIKRKEMLMKKPRKDWKKNWKKDWKKKIPTQPIKLLKQNVKQNLKQNLKQNVKQNLKQNVKQNLKQNVKQKKVLLKKIITNKSKKKEIKESFRLLKKEYKLLKITRKNMRPKMLYKFISKISKKKNSDSYKILKENIYTESFHEANKKLASFFTKHEYYLNSYLLKKKLQLFNNYKNYRYVNKIKHEKNDLFTRNKNKIKILLKKTTKKKNRRILKINKKLYGKKKRKRYWKKKNLKKTQNKLISLTKKKKKSRKKKKIAQKKKWPFFKKGFKSKFSFKTAWKMFLTKKATKKWKKERVRKQLKYLTKLVDKNFKTLKLKKNRKKKKLSLWKKTKKMRLSRGKMTEKKWILSTKNYFFVKQKLGLILSKLIFEHTGVYFNVKINFLITFFTHIKKYLKNLLKKRKKFPWEKKIRAGSWRIYKLLPYKKYTNVKILVELVNELIGAKRGRQRYKNRIEKMEQKGKYKKMKNKYLSLLNIIHNQIEKKKRRNMPILRNVEKIIKLMRPKELEYVLIRLNGKLNSRSRSKSYFFRLGKKPPIKRNDQRIFFEQIAISAKTGAFGLNFIGGKACRRDIILKKKLR